MHHEVLEKAYDKQVSIRKGVFEMGLFKRIKDTVKEVGLINEYCDHLRQIGINATILESESPKGISSTLSLGAPTLSLGFVKIEGKDIDLIQVDRQPTGNTGQMMYQYHYVVKANVEGLENKLKAESKPITKGMFSKEVIDLRWDGGEIAQLLNADSELKKILLKEELDKIIVRADRKQQSVSITHPPKIPRQVSVSIGGLPTIPIRGGGMTVGRKEFPTLEEFEAYNRIAHYVRGIISTQH